MEQGLWINQIMVHFTRRSCQKGLHNTWDLGSPHGSLPQDSLLSEKDRFLNIWGKSVLWNSVQVFWFKCQTIRMWCMCIKPITFIYVSWEPDTWVHSGELQGSWSKPGCRRSRRSLPEDWAHESCFSVACRWMQRSSHIELEESRAID